MRFHVLGLGPIGALLAHNLRRFLSPQHDIHLIFRTARQAKAAQTQPILIERDGVVSSSVGYKTESSEKFQEQLQNVVFNKTGQVILPSRESRASASRHSISEQFDKIESIRNEGNHIDSLFVTCKAYATVSALEKLQQHISSRTTMVLLQNGNLSVCERLLTKTFKEAEQRPHIVLASINHGAWIKAPLHVVHAGLGTLRFAILPDGRRDFERSRWAVTGNTPRLSLDDIHKPEGDEERDLYWSLRNTVAAMQGLSGLQPTWEPMSSLQIHLRQKLVVNCVINPLTALMGCNNGDLYHNPAADRLSRRLCNEAENVFRAEARANKLAGHSDSDALDPRLQAPNLHEECRRVALATAGNVSSMLAEVRRGSKLTEVDYLNGYMLQLGGQFRVPVPTHATMLDLIKLRTSIPLDTLL